MRKNLSEILKAFDAGVAKSGKTCWTNGSTVYSYQLPIVKRDNEDLIWIRESYPSITTQTQINACKAYFSQGRGFQVSSDLGRIVAKP